METIIISNTLIVDMYNMPTLEEVRQLVDNYKISNPKEYNKSIENAITYLNSLNDYQE